MNGTHSVLYAIEINEQCPAIFDYITNYDEYNLWTTRQKEYLKPDDTLFITVMVQNDGIIYKRNENYKIDSNGIDLLLKTPFLSDTTNPFQDCGLKIDPMNSDCLNPTPTFSENFNRGICQNDTIFEENFDVKNTLANEKRWKYEKSIRANGDGNEEFVVFNKTIETTFIQNEILHILPKLREGSIDFGEMELIDCTSTKEAECKLTADRNNPLPPILSAELSTQNSFRFKYGRVEIRAKMPKGDWIFPRLMLRPVHQGEPEIKIAFALGNENYENGTDYAHEKIGGNVLRAGLMWWEKQKAYNSRGDMLKPAFDLKTHVHSEHMGNQFHVYTLIWTETNLTFAFDGIVYGTIQKKLNDEHYIVLGVSVGGHYEFPDRLVNGHADTKYKPWENTSPTALKKFWYNRKIWGETWFGEEALQVDYVRVNAL